MKAVEAVPPPAQVLGAAADPAHGHLVAPAPLPAADASPDAPSRSQGVVSGNCSDEDGFTVVETVTLKVLDFEYTTPAIIPSGTMVNGNAGPAVLANGTLSDEKFLDSLASGAQTLKDDSNLPAAKANIVANSPFVKMNGAVNGAVNTRPKNSINSTVLASNSEPKILIIEKGNSKVASDSGINVVQNDLKSEDSSEGRPKTQDNSSKRELSKPLTNLVMNSSNVIEKLKNEQATNNEESVKGKVAEKLSSPLKQAIANGRAIVNGHGPVNGLTRTKIANEVNRDSAKTNLSNGKHADCRGEDIDLAAENGRINGNGFALMKTAEQPEKYGKGDSAVGLDAAEKGLDAEAEASWDRAVAGVKEQAFARLQEELRRAHQALKLRDEEVTRLSRIREEVEAELEELTASLFQEAHNMVREANVRQAAAERSYKESQMQVEVLTAEVAALKTLVLTSTPSRPNPHLHPQIDPRNGGAAGCGTPSAAGRSRDDATVGGVSLFNRKHRRSPSHFNLKYGRENSPPESPVKEQMPVMSAPDFLDKDGWEVDPNTHKEFVNWKQNPKLDKADPFISRIYKEDINLCLEFSNTELSAKVQEAIEKGNIFIEAVSDKNKTVFPKKCALFEAPRQCHYRMKLGDQEQWYYISQICRNRITAVCDFLNYLRYIERGLVKSSVHDVFWEITRLRKEMVLARLGLALSP